MNKDIILMKLSEIIQFIEETTNEQNITQVEINPTPYADDNLYVTGFRVDTPSPMIHLKLIKKLKLTTQQPQQVEYHLMNPDAELWIDCDALDSYTLKNTIDELNKQIYKTTTLEVMHVSYKDKPEDNTIERNIAYNSKRVACKDAMQLRKNHNFFKLKFSQAKNKDCHTISDLEFATAALE